MTADKETGSERRPGAFTRFSLFLGRLRGLFFPLAIFAVLSVGLHVGSDQLDDHLFVVTNALDSALDALLGAIIREVWSWFGARPETIDAATFRAADFIDLEAKVTAARLGALAFELAAVFVLALPVFFYRARDGDLRTTIQRFARSLKDPTILKVAAPLGVLFASVAGVFAVSREIQVLAHSLASKLVADPAETTALAAIGGLLAMAIVFVRIALPATLSAIGYAERIAQNEIILAVPASRRRMRGLFVAIFALPLSGLALAATPFIGTVRALVFW
jgi:hypothetical protein